MSFSLLHLCSLPILFYYPPLLLPPPSPPPPPTCLPVACSMVCSPFVLVVCILPFSHATPYYPSHCVLVANGLAPTTYLFPLFFSCTFYTVGPTSVSLFGFVSSSPCLPPPSALHTYPTYPYLPAPFPTQPNGQFSTVLFAVLGREGLGGRLVFWWWWWCGNFIHACLPTCASLCCLLLQCFLPYLAVPVYPCCLFLCLVLLPAPCPTPPFHCHTHLHVWVSLSIPALSFTCLLPCLPMPTSHLSYLQCTCLPAPPPGETGTGTVVVTVVVVTLWVFP